jgi:hypothetical protein
MIATALPYPRTACPGRRPSWLLPLLLLAVATTGLVLCAHALKHSLVDTVRNCPSNNIGVILLNPITGRRAILCEYEPGQWGRIITEDGKEVTSYAHPTRRAMNTLTKALQNLLRGGYEQIEYIKPGLSDAINYIIGLIE